MKITTNFVAPVQRAVIPLRLLSWGLAGTLVLLAAALASDGQALRSELPSLRARVARSLAATPDRAAETQPSERELGRTRERVAQLNSLSRTVGVTSAVLMVELEALLPPQAWLTRLHYRATEGEVRLVAAAPGAEPLSAFLLALERSALFEQAMLMREVQTPGMASVQFEIRLKVRT